MSIGRQQPTIRSRKIPNTASYGGLQLNYVLSLDFLNFKFKAKKEFSNFPPDLAIHNNLALHFRQILFHRF